MCVDILWSTYSVLIITIASKKMAELLCSLWEIIVKSLTFWSNYHVKRLVDYLVCAVKRGEPADSSILVEVCIYTTLAPFIVYNCTCYQWRRIASTISSSCVPDLLCHVRECNDRVAADKHSTRRTNVRYWFVDLL